MAEYRGFYFHCNASTGVSMRRYRITDVDRDIIQHCEHDYVSLHNLLENVPRGTLYRHTSTLLAMGLLEKRGSTYRATEQGKRRLEEVTSNFDWNIWDHVYPPMRWVPTPQHRAVL